LTTTTPADRGRRALGLLIGVGVVLGAVVTSVWVYVGAFVHPRTDDAYVRANVVGIAPHVGGPIVELPIVDNQPVAAGELLFVVDPRPYQAELELRRAALELTQLEVRALADSVRAAEAQLAAREADALYAQQYLQRIEPLLGRRFVTPNDVVEARSRARAAEAAVASARSEVAKAENLLGQYGDVNARVEAARAAVDDAQLDVDYCWVRAPLDGYVTNLNIAVGEYANQGRQVVTLVDGRTWYVLANFREGYLSQIEPGMEAEIFLASYPMHRFRGVVQGIGWGLFQRNGATVEGLPEVAQTLNWVRLAQRFPVRIVLQDADPERPFRMGQTAVVTIRPPAS
jgi:membrane fusion protein, multidrug efflux system